MRHAWQMWQTRIRTNTVLIGNGWETDRQSFSYMLETQQNYLKLRMLLGFKIFLLSCYLGLLLVFLIFALNNYWSYERLHRSLKSNVGIDKPPLTRKYASLFQALSGSSERFKTPKYCCFMWETLEKVGLFRCIIVLFIIDIMDLI